MPKQKHFYYVAVDTGEGLRLVTNVDYSGKTARWAKDAKPISMSKDACEDLVFGLCMNLTPAFLLTSFFEIEAQFVTGGVQNE